MTTHRLSFVALVLCGCLGESPPDLGEKELAAKPPTLVAIALQPASPALPIGLSLQLRAIGTYSNGATADLTETLIWTSSNAAAASVSDLAGSKGLTRAHALGATTITASQSGRKAKSGSTTVTVTPPVVVALDVFPASWTLPIGIILALQATGTYSDGTVADVTGSVAWSSSDTAVVTVAANGHATGQGLGSATITASIDGQSDTVAITGIPAAFTSLSVTPAAPSVYAGSNLTFTATGRRSDGTTADLTGAVVWSSSDEAVATIDEAGVAEALAEGTTTIRATYLGLGATTTLTVTPPVVVGVAVNPSSWFLPIGIILAVEAVAEYSDGSTVDVTHSASWSSSDAAVATVSSIGHIVGHVEGAATVSASFGGFSDGIAITVIPAAPVSLTVFPATWHLPIGIILQLSATSTYSDGSVRDTTGLVTWSSSDESLVTITNAPDVPGRAVGHAPGVATVTAQLGGLSDTTVITVIPAAFTSISIAPARPVMEIGGTLPLTATGRRSDGSTADLTANVTWSSSNPAVADIDAGGLVAGLSEGGTTIGASFLGLSASQALHVLPEVASIRVFPDVWFLPIGIILAMTCEADLVEGGTRDVSGLVTWSSSDESLVTVEDNGHTHGHALGDATLTAELLGHADTAVIHVIPAAFVAVDIAPGAPSLAAGRTVQLTSTGRRSDGTTADLTADVVWTSANPAVARVDDAGLVTAVAEGAAAVGASYLGLSDSVTVTVTPPELDALTVIPESWFLPIGIILQAAVTAHFSDGSTADVTSAANWASLDPSVATVNAIGRIVGHVVGDTEIVAAYGGFTVSITIHVIPAAFTSVSIAPVDASVRSGATLAFTATGGKSDGTTQDLTGAVTWSSSDPAVATIDAAGVARGLAVGTTTVRADYLGLHDETSLDVLPVGVISLNVTPSAAAIVTGATTQLAATGTFSDGTVRDVTSEVFWSSANPTVAQVMNQPHAQGRACGIAAGDATLEASIDGITAGALITVSGLTLVSVTVAPQNSAPISEGNSEFFRATGHFAGGTTRDLSAETIWTSSQPKVAAIRNGAATSGNALAIATLGVPRGTPIPVVMTAAFGQLQATGIMNVRTRVASFGTRPAGPVLTTGTTLQLRSFVRYSDGTDVEVTGATSWSGTPLLTIDPSGLATGVSAGSTSVGAFWFDPIDNLTRFASQAATVTDATLSSIQVTAGLTSVAEGGILQHEANGTYSDGAKRDLTTQVVWSSSDEAAVTVSNAPFSSGLAFVAGIDTSPTIVATHAGVSGQRTLTIPSQTLIALDVKTAAAPPLILPAGTKQTLIVEGVYSNGGRVSFGPQVEWSSSDGELGFASSRWFDVGTVFGSAPGEVSFSATVLGVTGVRTGTVTFR